MQALPLAGRYRFLKRLSAGPPRTVWLAEDVRSGLMVIAVRLAPRFGRLLAPVVRVQHPHLACLLDIVRTASRDELPDDETDNLDAPIAVAEWVSGQTLYDALMQEPIPVFRAVQNVASVASAVAAVHANGAFHGAISARSVVIERVDDGPGPVLTQVIMPPDGSYASPERLAGQGPGQEDDVWALHVLLYAALTGQRPFRASTREELLNIMENASPVPLDAFGVGDAKLQKILDRGFSRDISRRTSSIQAMETELFAWLATFSTEQAISREAIEEADRQLAEAAASDEPAEREVPREPEEARTVMTPAPMQAALASLTAVGSPLGTDEPRGEFDSATATPMVSVQATQAPVEPSRPAGQQQVATEATPSPEEATHSRAEATSSFGQATPSPEAQPVQATQSPSTTRSGKLRPPEPSNLKLPTVLGAVGLLAVLAAAAGGYFFVNIMGKSGAANSAAAPSASRPPAFAPTAKHTPTSTSRPAESTAPPVPKAPPKAAAPPQDVSACVADHFTPTTFANKQDLAFVCEEQDPRRGALTMRTKIVRGSGGKLTDGMNMWPRLGWHELLVYGMLRRKCCAGGPSIELPQPTGNCASLEQAINALSSAFAEESHDLEAKHASFVDAATCALHTRDRAYKYPTGPLSGGQLSYDGFLKRNTSQ